MLALADDLSGAAETAVALRTPAHLLLGPLSDPVPPPADGEATVVDLDSRHLPADAAAHAVRSVTGRAAEDVVLFKKVDSLLRGNLAAEAAAYAEGGAGVVIATALPVTGRTVRDGVVHLKGAALHTTDAWRAEPGPAPESVAAALGDLPVSPVPLSAVRGPLLNELRARFTQGRHPVCDAETDADLDAIARAALQLGPGVRLLGTGGLAGAVGRVLGDRAVPRPGPEAGHGSPRPLLVVVGTAEPSAAAQAAHLVADGAHHLPLTADDLLRARRPLALPATGVTVVRIAGLLAPSSARRLSAALAEAVAETSYDGDLVLTGGETARRVLDALGITRLRPVGQIHHGAVHSRTPDGRSVVTRPGSFGESDSLLRIARALRRSGHVRPVPPHHPTGVTS
ncbi:four-carbon acid sugar kinase family protein [Streptomyces sp. SID13726]|nr:four-carbon acid sugar kinase family protein [Streptomyces sp. SID13726]